MAMVTPVIEKEDEDPEIVALSKNVRNEFKRYLKEVKRHTEGIEKLAIDSEAPYRLADRIAPLLNMDLEKNRPCLKSLNLVAGWKSFMNGCLRRVNSKKSSASSRKEFRGKLERLKKSIT